MVDPSPEESAEAPAAVEPKRSKLLTVVALALFLTVGGGGAAYWFMSQGGSEAAAEDDAKIKAKSSAPKGPAIYVELDPPFVVNFQANGMTRFLQVTIQILTRDPSTADLVKLHDPVIRNDLLMLLGNQSYETISTREGKEQLRSESLRAVARIMEAEGGSGKKIEQLYFTSFVMQ